MLAVREREMKRNAYSIMILTVRKRISFVSMVVVTKRRRKKCNYSYTPMYVEIRKIGANKEKLQLQTPRFKRITPAARLHDF
jgi:hypothetical protein